MPNQPHADSPARAGSPTDIGERLIRAFEAYLETASRREDDINKLLIVVSKLMKQLSDLTPTPIDVSPIAPAIQLAAQSITTALGNLPVPPPALPAPAPAPDAGKEIAEALAALTKALCTQEERLQRQEDTGAALATILERQTETNESLLKYLEAQTRFVAEMDAKRLPEHTDEERRGDLVFQPYEERDLAFLKESEVFGALSDDTLSTIIANGSIETHEAGKTVFVIGDPVTEVFIVRSGIVEICRPTDDPDRLNVVAYLTAGDSIGEMSIFISGDTRSSIARVPEGAEVLVLTFEVFMRLFKALPELALRLSSVFARRLKTSIKKERIQKRHRELHGDLRYFEMPTVIQTLTTTDQRTGTMTVSDTEGELIAQAFMDSGRIRFAKLGHLQGEEAFYQLFQTPLETGGFVFREGSFPEGFDQGKEITTPAASLIFEAVRLAEELAELKGGVPDPEHVYVPAHATLQWTDDSTRTLANGVWSMIRRKATVEEILESLPRSHYAIYSVLTALVESGQIE